MKSRALPTLMVLSQLVGCGAPGPKPPPIEIVGAATPPEPMTSATSPTTDRTATIEIVEDGSSGGAMTPAAQRALELTRARRFADAAVAWNDVARGETGDAPPVAEIARYELAEALYELDLRHASYSLFSEIGSRPRHIRFRQTVQWLVLLHRELPETANIVERFTSVSPSLLEGFDNPRQKPLYWASSSLAGQYAYRSRHYDGALSLFDKVDESSSYYEESLYFTGLSHLALHDLVSSERDFQRLASFTAAHPSRPAAGRWKSLGQLSLARASFQEAISTDPSHAVIVDPKRLGSVVDQWSEVDPKSEVGGAARLEAARALVLAGEYDRALGFVAADDSLGALTMRAIIETRRCKPGEAAQAITALRRMYTPIQKELTDLSNHPPADGTLGEALLAIRSKKAKLAPGLQWALTEALEDRLVRADLAYVDYVDAEAARLHHLGRALESSPLGNDVMDAATLARDLSLHNADIRARDIIESKRVELDAILGPPASSATDPVRAFPRTNPSDKGDDEHVAWPFDDLPLPAAAACKN